MKNIIVIAISLINLNLLFGQNIDDLNTNKSVATFLEKEINKKYTFKEIFYKEVELDIEDFEIFVKKIDLDNNGFTDLVVNGDLIILNSGNKDYKELSFKDNNNFYTPVQLVSITEIGNEKVLIFKTGLKEDNNIKVDSLIVKFGELLKYSKNKPKTNKIKEVQFITTKCYGSCPVFEIKLKSDRELEYRGKIFTNYIGIKRFKLNRTSFENLIGLIEYSELKNLKNFYSINWSDNQTGKLKIFYKNGDVKEIQDYGLEGTRNLQAIYKHFFEINKNTK